MLTLEQLFQMLAKGELSHTKLGSDGAVGSEHYEQLVSYTNLGLLELYKRFNLRQSELKLWTHADTTRYYLREDHLGDLSEMDSYTYLIYEEDNPLQDDFLKVLGIYNSDNEELKFNDTFAATPIMLQEPDVLVLIPEDTPQELSILFQASYPRIAYTDNFDPTRIQLNIPNSILQPLLYYIAASFFRGLNSSVAEGSTHPGVTYDTKYELACQKISMYSLTPTNDDTRQQFTKNGWV